MCTQAVPQRPKASFGFGHGHARLEPCHQGQPDGLVIVQAVIGHRAGHGNFDHADGNEQSGAVSPDGGGEVLRRHTENREGMAVDEHRLAHDIARCCKAGMPVVVAEHDHGVGVLGRIVGLGQQPSKRGPEAQQLEVVAGNDFRVFVLGLVVPRHAHLGLVGCQHSGECLVLVAQVLIHRIGKVVS